MVFVQLTAEEKLEVLLLAASFFAAAFVVAACLAGPFCPLNRWLSSRGDRKRRERLANAYARGAAHAWAEEQMMHHDDRQYDNQYKQQHKQQQQQHCFAGLLLGGPAKGVASGAGNCPTTSLVGPPPAYEAALRASRLHSLTGGGLVAPTSAPPTRDDAPGGHAPAEAAALPAKRPPALDLGDYFHAPRAPSVERRGHAQAVAAKASPAPQVRLRLWTRLLQPEELVERACGGGGRRHAPADERHPAAHAQRPLARRQLSIPHLFGSLVTLAGGANSARPPQLEAPATPTPTPTATPTAESATPDERAHSASGGMSHGTGSASGDGSSSSSSTSHSQSAQGDLARRRLRALCPVSSRVLHMNVASFSFVKDETLISARRHKEFNLCQLTPIQPAIQPATQLAEQPARRRRRWLTGSWAPQNSDEDQHEAKQDLCQLMVTICDVENLLEACVRDERSCALLIGSDASVYVQCELMVPKTPPIGKSSSSSSSSSSSLLRRPLRALQQSTSPTGSASESPNDHHSAHHTVSFADSIAAAAVFPAATSAVQRPIAKPEVEEDHQPCCWPTAGQQQQVHPELEREPTRKTASCGASEAEVAPLPVIRGQALNWRHDPEADGRPIVSFSSVPKQLAALVADCATSGGADLLQFDSVFVSPLINRKWLAEGHLRLRLMAQCRYLNESCLAELKLPLGNLVAAGPQADNLADFRMLQTGSDDEPPLDSGKNEGSQRQAELILDKLLANLVTASTGTPLSQLVEQLESPASDSDGDSSLGDYCYHSPEDDDKEEEEEKEPNKRQLATGGSLEVPPNGIAPTSGCGNSLRSCASLNETHFRLQRRKECALELQARRLEANYCRSLAVSHWLNYLPAPAYTCASRRELRGSATLAFTYLPTSNRVVFIAHKAELDELACSQLGRLLKELRLESAPSYLLKFIMLSENGRVLQRKQTAASRKLEWDSQEHITFDLSSTSHEEPQFVVVLCVRSSLAGAELAERRADWPAATPTHKRRRRRRLMPAGSAHSEPESLRGAGGAACLQPQAPLPASALPVARHSRAQRDLPLGHFVLAEQIWRQMKAQCRKQIVSQFHLY